MPSIIEGYNYDIFISYRQKDNKGDRWVSEFVEALKTELESTFKEEISVYFDINPHDGLLETHDVDASLKEKLKCLVFIPIISRTYCDPKSFAWEHEFKAFVEQASQDQFGLKVKLPGSNVANRVLPVRIHDLDNTDIKLCESILGGFLRGIEFTYKSPGVNRPLRAKEDNPHDNLNHTIYRDQINKIANAISEIISGFQRIQITPAEETKDEKGTFADANTALLKEPPVLSYEKEALEKKHIIKTTKTKKKIWIYSLFSSVIFLLAVVTIFIFSSGSTLPFSKRDWVVITDFENLTENPVFDKSLYTAFSISTSQSRYINVFPRSRMLETLTRMEIKDQTFVDEKIGKEMAIREGINIYIVPSISEVGNRYAIAAKIMETKSGDILKSEIIYAETQDDILATLDQLSKRIRRDLGESRYNIAMQEKPLVKATTSSLEALKLYSMGIDQHNMLDFEGARDSYESALRMDTGFTAAKASLGNVNIRAFDPVKGREYLSQAVKSVDNLTEREKLLILAVHAGYVENNIPKTIEYFRMLIQLYPDDPRAHNNLGYSYQISGEYEKAVKEYKEAIRIDPHAVIAYGGLLWVYLDCQGKADSALVWSLRMISDNPQNAWGYMNLGSAWLCLDSLLKAEEAYIKARKINPDLILTLYRLAHVYRLQKKYDKAISILKYIPEINQNEVSAYYDLGVNYQSMGNQEEAHKYFSIYKKAITEECIKQRPINAESFISLAEVMARLGEIDSSQQTLQKVINIDSTQHLKFAEVLCLQGKVMEAIEELEKAFGHGYRDLFWLKLTPDLQILQYDTRYRDLLDKYFKQKL